ncbi:uncharacterized protein [Parasteatoda tepidariorum]|uniref:uncharacterized protein n=1 Tax=Parasteatoda tepidariorum TaxID=114398 RepID=UPI001C71A526|nr:pollen-specific leucine-rich repeat extensin-like protein 3 [Parasteatoda tepidariorum]
MERFRTSSPLTSTPRRGIPRSTRRSPHRLSPASSRSSPAIPSTSHQIPTQSPIDRSRSPEALRKSPFLSPQDHIRRTVSPETSPKYLRIPSPGTPLQYSLASSLGGSTQSPGSPIEYPGSPIESPGGPIESPGSPIESPVARTPSPRPRARRRLYKTPSPVRPELITPSPKTPPWETAFRRALYPTPPQPPTPPSPDTPSPARPTASPIHPIRGLPFTSRQTISPERESLFEFGSDFVRLKRLPRIPLEQRQGTPPDQKYHYASPGVTPQIIVSEDSSIEDENIPPEFRGLVPAYETEKLFCPRELEGKPEHEELLSLMKKFYEGDYENIKEAIRELAKKYIPQMRGEKNTIMILKALENYIEGLLVTIHTHDQSGRSELLKMAQERMNELRSEFMEEKDNFNRYIEMLESKLMEEARDNRRLVGKEIELESQLRSLQEKMAQPLVVEREEYEKYEQELELVESIILEGKPRSTVIALR